MIAECGRVRCWDRLAVVINETLDGGIAVKISGVNEALRKINCCRDTAKTSEGEDKEKQRGGCLVVRHASEREALCRMKQSA